MAYIPPTLVELRTVILRSLRDPVGKVFTATDIDDMVVEAMSDLSQYRPVEETYTFQWPGDGVTAVEVGDLYHIWHVELEVAGEPQYLIPPNEQGYPLRNGWEMYAGAMRLSAYWNSVAQQLYDGGREPYVVMWGYRNRNIPIGDAEVLDFQQSVDEMGVRKHARMQGFALLAHDRSLYQQWLAATNNTDVSPTQLQGMLSQATGEYETFRKRAAIIRRIPVFPSYTT